MEAVAPLKVGDIIIGYLMLGQLLLEDGQNRRQKWNRMYDRVKNYEIDFEALENSFWKKNNLTQEKITCSCQTDGKLCQSFICDGNDISGRGRSFSTN